jgi:glucokinase
MSDYAVGIDLGGTNLKACLVHQGSRLIQQTRRATEAEKGPEHVLNRIADAVVELRAQAPGGVIAGVGIGAPGNIDLDRRTVSYPPNFPNWQVVDMRESLQQRLGDDLMIIVENDANCAGLGSAHYGVATEHDSFIMVTLGTGVGGAIIYKNQIFRGATGAAGEIGHVSIDYEGPVDRWGIAGAIEAYVGQHFLSRHARFRLLTRYESKVHDMAKDDLEDISPRMLYDAAKAGDEPAREVLAWAGHKLGCMLGSAINLLDLATIVVGGGVSGAGDFILEPARQAVRRYVMPGVRDRVKILRETSGNDVGMLGAAHLIVQEQRSAV